MKNLKEVEKFIKENSNISDVVFSNQFNDVLSQSKLEEYLTVIKETFLKHEIPTNIKKKTYGVIVEALENAMRHSVKELNFDTVFHKLDISRDRIELSFGNFIEKQDINKLEKHMELIASSDISKIKELMYTKASDGLPLTYKGGAGVGFFDIAIKSNGEIKYTIFEINSKHYFLTFINIK